MRGHRWKPAALLCCLIVLCACGARQPPGTGTTSAPAEPPPSAAAEPGSPLDQLRDTVAYHPGTGELTFICPEVPRGSRLFLQVSARLVMEDSFLSHRVFEEETWNDGWQPGETYTAAVDPGSLDFWELYAALQTEDGAQTLEEYNITVDGQGRVTAEGPLSPQEAATAYFREVVNSKEELVAVVRERVEMYRGGWEGMDNHHAPYPADFPPAQTLPQIASPDDFAVRYTGNPDAMGSVYAAVPVDGGQREMMLFLFKYEDEDGRLSWGTGYTGFFLVEDLAWLEQDIDLYAR